VTDAVPFAEENPSIQAEEVGDRDDRGLAPIAVAVEHVGQGEFSTVLKLAATSRLSPARLRDAVRR
jgi:hypothetical protein